MSFLPGAKAFLVALPLLGAGVGGSNVLPAIPATPAVPATPPVVRPAPREARAEFHARRQAFEAAIAANDYAAFQQAIAGSPMESKLTKDVFDTMVRAYNLRQSGDKEGARALMKSLGINPPRAFPHHPPRRDDVRQPSVH